MAEQPALQTIAYLGGSFQVRPSVNKEQIRTVVKQCYGLEMDTESEPKELVSYDDRNFLVKGKLISRGDNKLDAVYSKFDKFVLKIFNAAMSCNRNHYENLCKQLLALQDKCKEDFRVVYPIQLRSRSDDDGVEGHIAFHPLPILKNASFEGCTRSESLERNFMEQDVDSGECVVYHIVRMTAYIEGRVTDENEYIDGTLARNWGVCNGLLNQYLQDTVGPQEDPGLICPSPVWNMLLCSSVLKNTYVPAIVEEERKVKYLEVIKEFEETTLPQLRGMEGKRCWIHNDLNEQNLVVNDANDVVGVLDFDDAVYSYEIVDVGIAMMYVAVKSPPEHICEYLRIYFEGYTSVREISELERSLLFSLFLMRFVQSGAVSAYQYAYVDPGNEYLKAHTVKSWDVFVKLVALGEKEFVKQICA